MGPVHLTPLVQERTEPAVVQVVLGKPVRAEQLGPAQEKSRAKYWPGPQ